MTVIGLDLLRPTPVQDFLEESGHPDRNTAEMEGMVILVSDRAHSILVRSAIPGLCSKYPKES